VNSRSDSVRLTELVAELLRLKPHEIDESLTLAGTENWDSLTHMELIAALEQEFSVELSADDIVTMVSYPAIQAVLMSKGVAL
jgi:acyl carrier protein